MIATIRSEWIKLRTVRSNLVMAAAAVILPVAITLLSVSFMKTGNIDSETLSTFITNTGSLAVLLVGVVGVLCVTQEYSQGTIRLTLAATPGRTRVYVAKAVVAALFGAALIGLVIALTIGVGSAILEARDVPGPHTVSTSGVSFAAMIVMGALVAVLGMGIGGLTRNPPGAITTLILWPLLVEGIVGGLLSMAMDEDVRKWMPFQSGFNAMFLEPPQHAFDRWTAIGYFAAWTLAVSALAERSLSRRDA